MSSAIPPSSSYSGNPLNNPGEMQLLSSLQTTLQSSDASAAQIGNPNYDPNSADADPTHPSSSG